MSRRGRWVRWGLTLLIPLALLAHGLYWYSPRLRTATLEPARDAGRLLLDDDFDAALWLAHPHQNLAAAAQDLDSASRGVDAATWVKALARLVTGDAAPSGDSRTPVWPGFGPFPVPPASELAVAVDREGQGAAVARIHPTLAVVAKLSGRLADNPWLAGGIVEGGRVDWRGRHWHWTTEPTTGEARSGAERPPPVEMGSPEPALAWLRLGTETGLLPPGLYRLHRPPEAPGDLELVRWIGPPRSSVTGGGSDPESSGPEALAPAFGAAEDRFPGQGVVLAWRRDGGVLVVFAGRFPEDGLEMPPAAVLIPAANPAASPESSPRPRLPQEVLPSFLRGELEEMVTAEGRRILASGPEALARARELLASLAASPASDCPALWLDLAEAHRFMVRVTAVLEEVPLVSRKEVRWWRDGERLLAGMEGFRYLRVLCSSDGDGDTGGWALRWQAGDVVEPR